MSEGYNKNAKCLRWAIENVNKTLKRLGFLQVLDMKDKYNAIKRNQTEIGICIVQLLELQR